jgi:hypothetical protein
MRGVPESEEMTLKRSRAVLLLLLLLPTPPEEGEEANCLAAALPPTVHAGGIDEGVTKLWMLRV